MTALIFKDNSPRAGNLKKNEIKRLISYCIKDSAKHFFSLCFSTGFNPEERNCLGAIQEICILSPYSYAQVVIKNKDLYQNSFFGSSLRFKGFFQKLKKLLEAKQLNAQHTITYCLN